MPPGIRFLGIRIRAFAQATEVEERVLRAVEFACGTGEVEVARTTGHFGNPMAVFDVELKKAADVKPFIGRMRDAGILAGLAGQEDARTDEDCVFHFRLDKQKAYTGELALATGKDVIDVRMKVGVYPARREDAVRILSEWLADA